MPARPTAVAADDVAAHGMNETLVDDIISGVSHSTTHGQSPEGSAEKLKKKHWFRFPFYQRKPQPVGATDSACPTREADSRPKPVPGQQVTPQQSQDDVGAQNCVEEVASKGATCQSADTGVALGEQGLSGASRGDATLSRETRAELVEESGLQVSVNKSPLRRSQAETELIDQENGSPQPQSLFAELFVPSFSALVVALLLFKNPTMMWLSGSTDDAPDSLEYHRGAAAMALIGLLASARANRFRRDASDVAWHEQIVRESQPEGDVGEGERPPLKLRVAALIVRATLRREQALPMLMQASLMSPSLDEAEGRSLKPKSSNRKAAKKGGGRSNERGGASTDAKTGAKAGRIFGASFGGFLGGKNGGKVEAEVADEVEMEASADDKEEEVKLSAVPQPQLPAGANAFCKTWQVVSSTNYDEYLKKLGIRWSVRQLAARLRPEPTYSIVGGVLHGSTPGIGGTKAMYDVFHTGREIEIKMMGYRVLVTYEWEGDALVARMHAPDGSLAQGERVTIRRWVDATTNQLVAQSACGDIVCERRYVAKQQ